MSSIRDRIKRLEQGRAESAKAAAEVAAKDDEYLQRLKTDPAELERHVYWIITEDLDAAGLSNRWRANGCVLPGACRALANATGNTLAALLADVYERIGYEAAHAEDWPVVEAFTDVLPGGRGWPLTDEQRTEARAYLARMPGYGLPT